MSSLSSKHNRQRVVISFRADDEGYTQRIIDKTIEALSLMLEVDKAHHRAWNALPGHEGMAAEPYQGKITIKL